MAESYFQYAEHYFRILNAMNQAAQQGQAPQQNGYQQGGPQHHSQQRRGDAGGEGGEQPYDGSDGPDDQPMEGRAIPITAGAPE